MTWATVPGMTVAIAVLFASACIALVVRDAPGDLDLDAQVVTTHDEGSAPTTTLDPSHQPLPASTIEDLKARFAAPGAGWSELDVAGTGPLDADAIAADNPLNPAAEHRLLIASGFRHAYARCWTEDATGRSLVISGYEFETVGGAEGFLDAETLGAKAATDFVDGDPAPGIPGAVAFVGESDEGGQAIVFTIHLFTRASRVWAVIDAGPTGGPPGSGSAAALRQYEKG